MRPPLGMASRALVARLMMDSSSWLASVRPRSRSRGKRVSIDTLGPREWISRSVIPRSRSGIAQGCGSRRCLRAKESIRWVRLAPRWAASRAFCKRSAVRWSPGRRFFSSPRLPMITVSRLLKSWATPPVRCPRDSIFWAWNSSWRARSSSRSASIRWVMSRVTLAKPISRPSLSRIGSITTLAQKRLPSLRTRQPSFSKRPSRSAAARPRAGSPASRSSGV